MSRGFGKNKILGVWVSEEDYPKLQEFLDKFSAGDSFSDQLRNFIHWLVSQTEGIDQTKLALKLKETEEEQKKAEFQCLRARSRARSLVRYLQNQSPNQFLVCAHYHN